MGQKITVLLAGMAGLSLAALLLRPAKAPVRQQTLAAETAQPAARASSTPEPGNFEIFSVDIFAKFAYVAEGFPMGLSTGQTYLEGFGASPSEPLLKQPDYQGKERGYSFIRLGNAPDNSHTLVRDGDDLYYDKNNDEDLSNDKAIYSVWRNEIATEYELVDASGVSSLRPYQLWYFNNAGPRYYAKCHYAGQVSFGGYYTYQAVAFESKTPDGLFRDDGLWIDFNGNGSLEPKEHYDDGAVLEAAGKRFRLKLNYP